MLVHLGFTPRPRAYATRLRAVAAILVKVDGANESQVDAIALGEVRNGTKTPKRFERLTLCPQRAIFTCSITPSIRRSGL